ncbi:MAG: GNAT family N-acetyltransferase [Clostridia bacterium]|nr:GNAT family N-acetyltransferase [Clostridia bacterium]
MIDMKGLCGAYDIRRLGESDADAVLDLCRRHMLYYRYCGMEATRAQVLSDMRVAPPGVAPQDKYYVGFFRDGSLEAVMDLIDGYPTPDIAYIGFFMVDAAREGRGIGSAIIRDVCAYLRAVGKTAVRLAIAEDNPQANHFWRKNGFDVIDRAPMDGWTALVAERALPQE